MDYHSSIGDGFLRILFVENEGMAFGMSWGGQTGKLVLSIFRILAVAGIGYFIYKLTKKPSTHKGFLTAMALIFAGAFGNIIDSAFYGLIFDRGMHWDAANQEWIDWYAGTAQANFEGYAGFLQGVVVDMFQFQMTWPEWVPWVGGKQVFDAIWNFADASISIGVILIILRQKTFFSKKPRNQEEEKKQDNTEQAQISPEAIE